MMFGPHYMLEPSKKRMPCSQDLGKLSVQACFEEIIVRDYTKSVKTEIAGWLDIRNKTQ